jgi:CheY-like chemotaxis protein
VKDQSQRTKEELLGTLHDVSNALTVLLGWAQEARQPDVSREAREYALALITDEAERARELARRMIGAPTRVEAATLDVTVRRIVERLERERVQRGVHVSLVLDSGAQLWEGSALAQIAQNLLLNALAFAPLSSTVYVATSNDGVTCTLSVRDEGPGVPAGRKKSIFEGDSTREGGSGVGLRHARALAATLGASLELSGRGDGEGGAEFSLRLPLIPFAPVSFASVAPPPPFSSRGLRVLEGMRILLVEDDPAVIGLLDVALTARGATIVVSSTIHQVLEEQGQHDAVLLDLSPIQGRVGAAVAALRANSPAARFLITTGSVETMPVELAGAQVVRKPFDVGEIVDALAGV